MHPNPSLSPNRYAERSLGICISCQTGFGQILWSFRLTPSALVSTYSVPNRGTEQGDEIELHLVRSNPMARLLQNIQAPAQPNSPSPGRMGTFPPIGTG